MLLPSLVVMLAWPTPILAWPPLLREGEAESDTPSSGNDGLPAWDTVNEAPEARPDDETPEDTALAVPGTERPESDIDDGLNSGPRGWGFDVGAAFAHYLYRPLDLKDLGDDESSSKSDWSQVNTRERYRIDPVMLGRFAVGLRAPWLRLGITWSTDRVLSFNSAGASSLSGPLNELGATDLLDLVATFGSMPGLRRISILSNNVWFKRGTAELRDHNTGAVIERRKFELDLRGVEVRYAMSQPENVRHLGHTGYGFVRYIDQSVPRNVYLEHSAEGSDLSTYFPLAERLLRVRARTVVLGFGVDGPLKVRVGEHATTSKNRFEHADGGSQSAQAAELPSHQDGLRILLRVALGTGPYGVYDIDTNAPYTEGGWLFSALFGTGLSYSVRPWPWLLIGVRDVVDFSVLAPLTLPDDIKAQRKRDDLPTKDYSLSFGTIDLFNRLEAFVVIEY